MSLIPTIPPGRQGPREIPPIPMRDVTRGDATDVGLTTRSAVANAAVAFSPTPISHGREKTGVLNSTSDVAKIVDERTVGEA